MNKEEVLISIFEEVMKHIDDYELEDIKEAKVWVKRFFKKKQRGRHSEKNES